VIQHHIKTPLADEVLFGRLKNGGTVRVVVAEEEGKRKLTFMYPEGPALPKPDKEVVEARKKRKPKEEPEVRRARAKGGDDDNKADKPAPEKSGDKPEGDGGDPRGGGIVPHVPLKS
jgi:ATP-dependent Clp protease ATP-binding subunit ClpA